MNTRTMPRLRLTLAPTAATNRAMVWAIALGVVAVALTPRPTNATQPASTTATSAASTKPGAGKPASTKPGAVNPGAVKPVVAKPVAVKPVVAKPCKTSAAIAADAEGHDAGGIDDGGVEESALAGFSVETLSKAAKQLRHEAIRVQGGWVPAAGPLSVSAARRLLRRPKGSVSLGVTSRGRLLSARKIKPQGPHYRFFPHIAERDTVWGTDEMQRFISRVSTAVARRHKGAEMRIGNISLHGGGRSPWHHSHQAGRDVDICFYARDRAGQPVKMDDFRKFRRTGYSRDGELVFDDERNLDVALAMLAQEETPVQWVFVARWLKRRMLNAAEKRGVAEPTRLRLAKLLRQPGDSAPHDDHFHVRLFCSLQDRKHGCLDRGPQRAWVDRFDDAFAAHVARVAEASTVSDAKLRLQAVELLGRIEARGAGDALLARLADADGRVREAALRNIVALRLKDAGPGVLEAVRRTRRGTWAVALFEAWVGLAPEGMADVAVQLLRHPGPGLHNDLPKSARAAIALRSMQLLAESGRPGDVPALIAALSAPTPELRLAAHKALVALTNQSIRSRHLLSRNAKQRQRTIAAWQQFWTQSQAQGWLLWMKAGFRSHGVRLARGQRFVRRDVPRLIRALTSPKDPVARNAAKVLTRLTGHRPWLRQTDKRSLKRHWSAWWRARGRRVTLRT